MKPWICYSEKIHRMISQIKLGTSETNVAMTEEGIDKRSGDKTETMFRKHYETLDQQQMSLTSNSPFLGMKLHLNWDLKFPFEKCRRCNHRWFPSDYRFLLVRPVMNLIDLVVIKRLITSVEKEGDWSRISVVSALNFKHFLI